MCGIAGIISKDRNKINLDNLKKMSDTLIHRGPDGDGQWINEEQTVGLTHRRLSVLDLSTAGKQPMHYLDRYSITFNGEIYNYIELRESLINKGYVFSSNTDTEIILALYDYKKKDCLKDLDGMFAFAIWDSKEKKLFCARDRFGEKPFFYYHKPGEIFVFASEIKALWSFGITKTVNEPMLFNYLAYGYLHNPENPKESFYNNINKLEPHYYIQISEDANIIESNKYWDIDYNITNKDISFQEAKHKFSTLLFSSVEKRLRSDVPVGSSLSGGLDSSTIVCIINALSNGKIDQKVFSAKFPGYAKDESVYIEKVVQKIHAQAYSTYPDAKSFFENLDKLCYHQDEPFGSASIFAQYQVMKLAKEQNTIVLLDGQGADEVLAGYHGFIDTFLFELKQNHLKKFKEEKTSYFNIHKNNNINNIKRRKNRAFLRNRLSNKQINLLLRYKLFFQHIKGNAVVLKDFYNTYRNTQFNKQYKFNTLNEALYYFTMKGELQDLLRYADRNSMAHSREVRLPFLSHELVEFVFSLPATFKIHLGWTKYILRKAMENVIPIDIAWRIDKIGYEPPQKEWLASSLKYNTHIQKQNNRYLKDIDFANANAEALWKSIVVNHL